MGPYLCVIEGAYVGLVMQNDHAKRTSRTKWVASREKIPNVLRDEIESSGKIYLKWPFNLHEN